MKVVREPLGEKAGTGGFEGWVQEVLEKWNCHFIVGP